MQGIVKWFDNRKGYGFIEGDDGGEIYVHYTGIVCEGFRKLRHGRRVEYDMEQTPSGPQAVNVRATAK